MAQSATQQTVFGEPLEEQLYIETTGRVIRPFKRMVGQLVNEFRLHADEDGLHVSAMDAACVTGIKVTLHAEAFESYRVNNDVTLGVMTDTLGTALQHTRYGTSTNDPIRIVSDGEALETETERDVGGTDATVTERVKLIDHKSIREDFDRPDITTEATATLSPGAYVEALNLCDTTANAGSISLTGNELLTIRQDRDTVARNIELDVPVEGTATSLYSAGYLNDIAAVLNNGYVDTDITINWSDEFPVFVEFEREGVYSGEIMTAPRIEE